MSVQAHKTRVCLWYDRDAGDAAMHRTQRRPGGPYHPRPVTRGQ
jgi:hypothetical protein